MGLADGLIWRRQEHAELSTTDVADLAIVFISSLRLISVNSLLVSSLD